MVARYTQLESPPNKKVSNMENASPNKSAKPRINAGFNTYKPNDEKPQAAKLILIIGVICLIIGTFLSAHSYKQSGNLTDFLYLVYGILEFAACAGFASIINLLDEIRKNTDR